MSGFNIIEFIRKASDLLVDAGGHPMAAGFTVETARIKELTERFEKLAGTLIKPEFLERVVKIDTEIFWKILILIFMKVCLSFLRLEQVILSRFSSQRTYWFRR